MTKITMEDRVRIVKHMMEDVHGKAMKDAAKAVRTASEKAYKSFYAKELGRINRLPEGWLPTKTDISVQFNGMRLTIDFNREGHTHISLPGNYNSFSINNPDKKDRKDRIARRVLTKDDGYNSSFRVNEGHDAFDDFDALAKAIAAYDSAKETLKQDANRVFTVLKSMTTAEAVKKKWPEAAPYVAQVVVGDRKSTALAPNFDELNKRLGLPVSG